MPQAQSGNTVKVHYTGRLADGTVFDSSRDREPFEFVLGSGMVIPGFDAGVTGLSIGEIKTIEIPAKDAYGKTGFHPLSGKDLIFDLELVDIIVNPRGEI